MIPKSVLLSILASVNYSVSDNEPNYELIDLTCPEVTYCLESRDLDDDDEDLISIEVDEEVAVEEGDIIYQDVIGLYYVDNFGQKVYFAHKNEFGYFDADFSESLDN